MDQTAAKLHSKGVMLRTRLPAYLKSASEDFVKIVPPLIKLGFNLAIASFTDKLYPTRIRLEHPLESYICGEELMTEFLKANFDETIVSKFFLIGFQPDLHKGYSSNKHHHLELISEHYSVEQSSCVLFDDTLRNIAAAKRLAKYSAYVVPRPCFMLTNLIL